MIYDINKINELVEQGYIRSSTKDELSIYCYTEKTTHEKYWNEYTRAARGLILNNKTGEVIAKPFPKFFNLGEMPETYLSNLPTGGYTVSDKVDGSLGIIYYYNGKWNVATKGSFSSEQAIKAQEMLKNWNLTEHFSHYTFLVEIIYPENRIVVNYGSQEKLVLLGAYRTHDESEINDLEVMSQITGLPIRKDYDYTIDEIIALQKVLSKNEEGFVIRFDNGLRIKVKGEEYLKIHKIISNLSPLSFWEVMKDGKVPLEYIQQVPEEFIPMFEPIVAQLEKKYLEVKKEVEDEFEMLPTKEITPEAKKEVGLYLKKVSFFHESAMFPRLMNKIEVVDRYILKQIRPHGNSLNL